MMKTFLLAIIAVIAAVAHANNCPALYKQSNLSPIFNETIAHAIHSMTVQGLRLFNPRATANNKIPTVNQNLHNGDKVVAFAPEDPVGNDFFDFTMNMIDRVLTNVGTHDDGLGHHWSPAERIVHVFHMWDLWLHIQPYYQRIASSSPVSDALCECLLDTKTNGIYNNVGWVANHYESGTPISLKNVVEIPPLVDGNSWKIWKKDLLQYYNEESLTDAGMYLYCALKDF
ncbi:hypothetical protein AKO1_007026 [Acrasis kona]|uniref:Non-ribosomal peptide synthetase n=1 Tax=Acrasis kona TaxID=1008807 RepID=A0AAW2YUH6_9EUKA